MKSRGSGALLLKIMVWNAARGGMRSVVEGYLEDGFVTQHQVRLIHSYGDANFAQRQLLFAKALAAFVWLLTTRHIDLVHCHVAMRGSFWRKSIFARIATARGIPVVFHLHGSEMKTFFEAQNALLRSAIVASLERATTVVVLSRSWRDFVAKIAPRARIEIVPNYVTIPKPVIRSHTLAPSLLFLGAVGQRKGVFDLLCALAEARKANPELRLIVGGTGEIGKAKMIARNLGIEKYVEFVGWVDAKRRAELLSAAGIYVLPSYNEGLPMSVLEAMAAGLAVITTNVGGLPELIDNGDNGILVEPGDTIALASSIASLAADPEKRKRLGDEARLRVQNAYSRDVALGMLSTIYAKAVKTKRGV